MKYFAYLSALSVTSAFVLNTSAPHRCAAGALHAEADASRRTFLSSAFLATSASFVASCPPAFAEEVVDDLAMPTEEEEKAKIVSGDMQTCLSDIGPSKTPLYLDSSKERCDILIPIVNLANLYWRGVN